MTEYLIVFVISLCITMTVYLAFPVICMIRGKKYTAAKLKRIAVINSAAAWLILSVIIAAGGGEPSTNGILVWFPVSYWLLRKKCFEAPAAGDIPSTETEINSSTAYCPHCYKYIAEDAEYCPYCASFVKKHTFKTLHPLAKGLIIFFVLSIVFTLICIAIEIIDDSVLKTSPTPTPKIQTAQDMWKELEKMSLERGVSTPDSENNPVSPEFMEQLEAAKQRAEEREAGSQTTYTPVSYTNGEILNDPLGEPVCPLTVSVQGSSAYYIYLECVEYTSSDTSEISDSMKNSAYYRRVMERLTSSNDLSFMVKPHSTAEVLVPLGSYKLYYATGKDWFGPTLLFGDDTVYYMADEPLEFTQDANYVYGHTLELWLQSDGNMEETRISAADFPG